MTSKSLAKKTLMMPRLMKRGIVISVDMSLCVITVWLAFYLRLGEWIKLSGDNIWQPMWAVTGSLFLALPIFIFSGFYQAIFRYTGWHALMSVAKATGLYGLLFATVFSVIGVDGVPRTVGLIQPMLLLLAVGASRAFARFWLSGLYKSMLKRAQMPKVLIYGAGTAGRQLAAGMSNSQDMHVVGFLDDDNRLHDRMMNGLPIHNPNNLSELVKSLGISNVLLALPSASRKRRNEIIEAMLLAKVSVRTLPSLTELAQGKVNVSDLRDLDLDDLLGREPVTPDEILLSKNITNKVVLVTGAGGSIGSELCRQIIQGSPSKLLLIEQSEFALYAIHQELIEKYKYATDLLVPLLASVQDSKRMMDIMSAWKPDTVYHAAAYKHVPLVEHNPVEGIKNNVLGTFTTAQVALKCEVADFVLISTDKAVRPTNIMGASKRLAELVLQALADHNDANDINHESKRTTFSMVRFGNVLGSSGSVVPKFRQQIREGGPVTLTHPEITRYFMSIPEAAQLVIQAGTMAKGGDVFVLDMQQPIKIIDLATRMIELSGLTVRDQQNPDGDIEITITGLRHGEKLYEELLIGDNPEPTTHPRIMKAREEFFALPILEEKINKLQIALNDNDIEKVICIMKNLVIGYTPNSEIVDWISLETIANIA
jgi:FlaA1/EpsC-like NDP-sugar epimerase